jgi:excisionase family DNA binding protein
MEKIYSNELTDAFGRKEAARRLDISVATLDRLLARKRLACLRVGRRVIFTQQLLETFKQKCQTDAK